MAPSFPDDLLNGYIARRNQALVLDVDFGYRTVEIVEPDGLRAAQRGYGGTGWQSSWLVIATDDYLGDPIFTDLTDELLPVFTAVHGRGSWSPVQIADSFEGFVGGLKAVESIAARREHPVHPVGLEEHPLSDAERTRVLDRVRDLNPRSDVQFWEDWLTIDY